MTISHGSFGFHTCCFTLWTSHRASPYFALSLLWLSFFILLVEGYLIVVSLINYPFSYVSVVFVEF